MKRLLPCGDVEASGLQFGLNDGDGTSKWWPDRGQHPPGEKHMSDF